ncbi:hypothetical protein TELCIR_06566 [Teladorsagia circumcincta]|uniref:Uncharacterized protein n=1 Tax=Teladorsagia circumcincta TaxID=45464 RepID=A0A2G9UMS0_TELCI|nr:hypothetical protein TELCIR_06566 [Teladorsagia circumcincta]
MLRFACGWTRRDRVRSEDVRYENNVCNGMGTCDEAAGPPIRTVCTSKPKYANLKKCERLNHVSRYPVHPSSAAPHDTKFSKTYLNKDRKGGNLLDTWPTLLSSPSYYFIVDVTMDLRPFPVLE